MGHPSKGNQGGSKDDNPGASASRWRHQESSRYARHAADTVGNPPMSQIRPANEHAGTSDLTSFLNTTRIEGTGPPLSETSGQASAGGRAYRPISADGYGQFDGANERVATANAPPPVGLGGAPLGGTKPTPGVAEAEVQEEIVDGKEVRCGPLLNYRRMEGSTWHGSVLVVLEGGITKGAHEAWVPELLLKKIAPRRPEELAEPSAQIYADAISRGTEYDTAVDASIDGELLYADLRNRFWRFNIALQMEELEAEWAYQIPSLRFPSDGKTDIQNFWVPSINESMRIMFHSCNGFSVGTDEAAWSGPALWNDVHRVHSQTPFHVM